MQSLTPNQPASPFAASLLKALDEHHASRTIVLCASSPARDDIIAAIAPHGPWLGLKVLTVDMLISHAARSLAPRVLFTRSEIARRVTNLLEEGQAPTAFHRKGLHQQPATREALTDAIVRLFALPENLPHPSESETLPFEVARMAAAIKGSTAGHFFTQAEAAAHAISNMQGHTVIVAGDFSFDPLSQWVIDNIGAAAHIDVRHPEPLTAHASFVEENDEALWVAGQVVQAVEAGIGLHEMAIAYCEDPYLPLLGAALSRAGIPFSAPSAVTLAVDPHARALALLLRMDPDHLVRTDLAELIGTGVLKDGPSMQKFDRVTRAQGRELFSGADWDIVPDPGMDQHAAAQLEDITHWVRGLRTRLRELWQASDWEELNAGVQQLRRTMLRSDRRAAFGEVIASALAAQAGPVSQARAAEVALETLKRPFPHHKEGTLQVGPLESVAGRGLKKVFICGATDTALPGTLAIDPCISAQQSGTTAEVFLDRRERQWAAATACAEAIIISYPRSRIDSSGLVQPSLWAKSEDTTEYPSLHSGHEINLDETDIAAATRPSAKSLSYRSIMRERLEGEFSSHNGNLENGSALRVLEGQLSTTALESFAQNPQFFFVERVAGGWLLEDGEVSSEVAAADRGTLYHQVFQDFIDQIWINNKSRPARYRDTDWAVAHALLMDIADATLEEHRPARVTEAAWKSFTSKSKRVIEQWFIDERADAEAGWEPLATELGFGADSRTDMDKPPLEVELRNGKSLQFKGYIDRIDVAQQTDGTVAVRVTDYKSGKGSYSSHITQENPTGNAEKGFKFQLALYGELVRAAATGRWKDGALAFDFTGVDSVSARYWFFSDPKTDEVAINVTDSVHERLLDNLTNIYEHIAAGHFPPMDISKTPYLKTRLQRLGRETTTHAAQQLEAKGHTPLPITTPEQAAPTDTSQ